MKKGKIWGETEELFNKNNVSIERMIINKGGQCSKHLHDIKNNIFFVEKGKILVEEWQTSYDLVDKTILIAGQSCLINRKKYHRFTGIEDSIVFEIYYVELEEEDIQRETVGKKNEIYNNSKQ